MNRSVTSKSISKIRDKSVSTKDKTRQSIRGGFRLKTTFSTKIKRGNEISNRFGLKLFDNVQKHITHMDKNNQNPLSYQEIQLDRLKKKLEDTQIELRKVKEQLHEKENENIKLKILLDHYVSPKDKYDESRTWVSKLVFIVTQANKPLRSADIISLLLRREPMLQQKSSKEKFISPSLNAAMKFNRLIPYKLHGVRGKFYCLPDWLNEKGELLPEMRNKIY